MIFLKYKQPKAEYVQFQRLISGVLVISAVLFENIQLIELFLALSIVSFVTTISYSPTTLLFKFLSFIFTEPLFVTAPQYVHSYLTYRLAEIFEDIMQISGGACLLYLYTYSPLATWVGSAFMSITMLISSFFGFCLSSLMYIAYKNLLKRFGSSNEWYTI